MKLKNRNETPGNGGFLFYFEADGKVIPVDGVNSLSQLTSKAEVMMRKAGVDIPDDLEKVVEHQICARQTFPAEECWMGGIGDVLHHKYIKPFLQATAEKAGKKGVRGLIAKVAKAIASCGGCSGKKVHKGKTSRAERLNKLGNRILAKIKRDA